MFTKVKTLEEKRALLAEYLKNRKLIQEQLLQERIAKQEHATSLERFHRPVVEAIREAKKKDELDEIKDGQDRILEALKHEWAPLPFASTSSAGPSQSKEQKTPESSFESDSESDALFHELSDVETKKQQTVFSPEDTKRLLKLNVDPSLKIRLTREQTDHIMSELQGSHKKQRTSRSKKIIENQMSALKRYNKKIQDTEPPPPPTPPPPKQITADDISTLRSLGIMVESVRGEELVTAINNALVYIRQERDVKEFNYGNLPSEQQEKANARIEKLVKQKILVQNYQKMLKKLQEVEPPAEPKIVLDPYWSDGRVHSFLRPLDIDTTFAKIPTKEELKQKLSEKQEFLKKGDFWAEWQEKDIKEEIGILKNYLNDLPQIQAYSTWRHKTGMGLQKRHKKWKCAPVRYYKNPNELCDRLELLLASRDAGNTSATISNEAVGIIDQLLNDKFINAEDYKALNSRIHRK